MSAPLPLANVALASLYALLAALPEEEAAIRSATDEIWIVQMRLQRHAGLCEGGLCLSPEYAPWHCAERAVLHRQIGDVDRQLCAGCAARLA